MGWIHIPILYAYVLSWIPQFETDFFFTLADQTSYLSIAKPISNAKFKGFLLILEEKCYTPYCYPILLMWHC